MDYVGHLAEDKNEIPYSKGHYENVFSLNTAGLNRIYFCVEGSVGRRLIQAWVNAIRLASWEKVRLEEIYTGALLRARMGAIGALQRKGSVTSTINSHAGAGGDADEAAIATMAIKSPLSKGKLEGWVQARFMGSTEWKQCWLVLVDKPEEADAKPKFWSKLGGAGSRSSVLSLTTSASFTSVSASPNGGDGAPRAPGQAPTLDQVEPPPGSNGAKGMALFYEDKKAKTPFAVLMYAAHAFAVYPSRPELVEGSSLFKIEGAFPMSHVLSGTDRLRETGWVMLMPDKSEGATGSSSSNSSKGANAEMMKWVIGFMDAFRLYGRPETIDWEPRNPISAFFAYPIGAYKDRLFLDRELAEFLDIREERHLAHRANLHGIMSMRMRGERTPILAPLPQPNKDSTAALNPAAMAARQNANANANASGSGVPGASSSPSPLSPGPSGGAFSPVAKPVGSTARPELPVIGASQPLSSSSHQGAPSPIGSGQQQTGTAGTFNAAPIAGAGAAAAAAAAAAATASGSSAYSGSRSGNGLESIGERSREASNATTGTTLPASSTMTGLHSQGPSYARSEAREASNSSAAGSRGPSPLPPGTVAPANTAAMSPTAGQPTGSSAPPFAQNNVTAAPSVVKPVAISPVPVPAAAAPAVPIKTAAVSDSVPPPVPAPAPVPVAASATKRDSDAGLYDETALFYMRTMSDQLPAPSSTAAGAPQSASAIRGDLSPASAAARQPQLQPASSQAQRFSRSPSRPTPRNKQRPPPWALPARPSHLPLRSARSMARENRQQRRPTASPPPHPTSSTSANLPAGRMKAWVKTRWRHTTTSLNHLRPSSAPGLSPSPSSRPCSRHQKRSSRRLRRSTSLLPPSRPPSMPTSARPSASRLHSCRRRCTRMRLPSQAGPRVRRLAVA